MIRKCFKKFTLLIMCLPRKLYYKKRRRSLTNQSPTIICNNCIGGFIYNNLGLMFRSPTINLFMSTQDFILFAKNLKEYLNADLVEVKNTSKNYPVGQLTYNNNTITLFFMHYKNFENAKEKWDKRKIRVNFSNMYLIYSSKSTTYEEAVELENLNYKHKLFIMNKNPLNSKNVIIPDIFKKENSSVDDILKHKSYFSLQRYMDDIDYINFLNSKN